MNKKGLTIIELIITIALVSVIMIFLYKLLATISFESDSEYLDITDRTLRSEIIRTIEDSIIDYNTATSNKILNYKVSGSNLYLCPQTGTCNNANGQFIITLSSDKKTLTFKKKDNSIKQSWTLKKGSFQTLNDSVCIAEDITSEITILKCNIQVYTKNINNKVIDKSGHTINNNNTLDDIEFTFTQYNIKEAVDPDAGGDDDGPIEKTCHDYNLDEFTFSQLIDMYQNRTSVDEYEKIMKCIEDHPDYNNLRKTVVIGSNSYKVRIINTRPCPSGGSTYATNSSCGLIFKFMDPYKSSAMMATGTTFVPYNNSLAHQQLNAISGAKGTTIPEGGGEDTFTPLDTLIAYNIQPGFGTSLDIGSTTAKYYLASPVEVTNSKCMGVAVYSGNAMCNYAGYCNIKPSSSLCGYSVITTTFNITNNMASEDYGWFRDYAATSSTQYQYYFKMGASYSYKKQNDGTGVGYYPIFRIAN